MYSKEDSKRLDDMFARHKASRKKRALDWLEIRGYSRDPQKAVNKMREDISNLMNSVNKIFPQLKTWHVWVGMISISMILSSLGFHHETHGDGVGTFIALSFIGGLYIIYHNSKEDKKLEEIKKLSDYMEDTKKRFNVK